MHLWKVTENDWYPQLHPFAEQVASATLCSDFMPADYTVAATDLDVQGLVHVSATSEPQPYLEETQWVDQLANEHGLDLVTIGGVDPELSEREMLADLETQAANPRYRGVRIFPGTDPDLPAATVLLAWLEENDQVFDLVTQPKTMPAWAKKLARHPKPAVGGYGRHRMTQRCPCRRLQQWCTAITDLARNTDLG